MRCIGFRYVEFKPSGSADTIKGYSCSFMSPFDVKSGTGYNVEKEFLSEDRFREFDILNKYKNETEFEVFYNRYGKIQKII